MKLFRKIMATVLALVTIFSLVGVSASAADTTDEIPVLAMKVVSENSTSVTVNVALVSGGFEALDFGFETSSNIKECSLLKLSTDFRNARDKYQEMGSGFGIEYFKDTKKVAIASTIQFIDKVDIVEATFTKKSSANITKTDISLDVTNCVVTKAGSGSDVSDKVGIYTSFDTIKLSEESKTISYKSSTTLDYETTLSKNSIVWSSSNEKVAKVDENGKVTATGRGTAVITAGTADGIVKAECKLTVNFTTFQWIIYILLFGFLWY